MHFNAKELKERVDLLVDAGAEVIEIEDERSNRCFISGYSPSSEYKPLMRILEEED